MEGTPEQYKTQQSRAHIDDTTCEFAGDAEGHPHRTKDAIQVEANRSPKRHVEQHVQLRPRIQASQVPEVRELLARIDEVLQGHSINTC
eukprot:12716948-Alexandrium_andersonii.AAC.1